MKGYFGQVFGVSSSDCKINKNNSQASLGRVVHISYAIGFHPESGVFPQTSHSQRSSEIIIELLEFMSYCKRVEPLDMDVAYTHGLMYTCVDTHLCDDVYISAPALHIQVGHGRIPLDDCVPKCCRTHIVVHIYI